MRTRNLLATVATLTALAGVASACGTGAAADSGNSIGVGYFKSATIGPEVLVAGNKDLAGKVEGELKLTPIDSGVAGLAQLRGGAFPFVSGVGNPPVVGSIAQDTKVKVVYAEYFDAAQLIVPSSVKTDQDLAGKTVGALQGSSEDFEIRGWLESKGLTDTKVVGFPSEQAITAAYKAKKIDAAYTEIAGALDLKNHYHGRQVVTAEEIANLGYPSLNVLAVTDAYASKNKKQVQQFVCQVMHAQTLAAGSQGKKYITTAAQIVGAPSDQAVDATSKIPWVKAQDQLSWFEGPSGKVEDGKIAKAYALTGKFLVDQGRTKTVPSSAQIASHLDSSYVKRALKDGCDK